MEHAAFLKAIAEVADTTLVRAVALLWRADRSSPGAGLTARQIASALEAAGYARQNVSRLDGQLASDRRVVKDGKGGWRLSARSKGELDAAFAFTLGPLPVPPSDGLLPRELFANTRGYIERVVEQINGSYDVAMYDCCAVMCRRLVETLIVEVYEFHGRADDIKSGDGHFMMLNGLIAVLEKDKALQMSRNALKGLKDFKALGDLSAHNRRFNATRPDLDRIRDGLRIAAEDLLHLANLR